jgi:hypothetical protein
MPEREHAPVPYRRCRFDGGCCRADPVARARPPPHRRRPRYRVHHSAPRTEFRENEMVGRPTSSRHHIHHRHTTAGLDIESMVGRRFAARVSLGAASAARFAGELVVPLPSRARDSAVRWLTRPKFCSSFGARPLSVLFAAAAAPRRRRAPTRRSRHQHRGSAIATTIRAPVPRRPDPLGEKGIGDGVGRRRCGSVCRSA